MYNKSLRLHFEAYLCDFSVSKQSAPHHCEALVNYQPKFKIFFLFFQLAIGIQYQACYFLPKYLWNKPSKPLP